MDPVHEFESRLSAEERELFRSLSSPPKIQAFLDSIPYRSEEVYHPPTAPLRDRAANCWDGALLAVAALRRLGHPPLLLQLYAERDDEHLLALYKVDGHYGAVAKSNFVGLRYREAVYRSLRELVLSYFEVYFNLDFEKALRGYTRPVNMARFDRQGWMWSEECMQTLLHHLDHLPRVPVVSEKMARRLSLMDPRSREAHMLGINLEGVFVPPPREGSKG